jgi:cytochrome c5
MKSPGKSIPVAVVFAAAGCSGQPGSVGPVSLPEPQSPGALLLTKHCGLCHGAPAPSVHTAEHWPGVLYRMQNRMAQKGIRPLSDDELNTLRDYLLKHSRGAT